MHASSALQTSEVADRFAVAVLRACPADRREWLEGALRDAADGPRRSLLTHYSGAARRLRSTEAALDTDGIAAAGVAGLHAARGWPPARLARAALLVVATDRAPREEAAALIEQIFRTGDNPEREALLGALAGLADPSCHLDVAIEACRSNVAAVFEAIACENPYPASWFPDPSFNQMVLKAMFVGVALARIDGLESRRNDDLARMARDYADERRAAGRPVPMDISLVDGDDKARA